MCTCATCYWLNRRVLGNIEATNATRSQIDTYRYHYRYKHSPCTWDMSMWGSLRLAPIINATHVRLASTCCTQYFWNYCKTWQRNISNVNNGNAVYWSLFSSLVTRSAKCTASYQTPTIRCSRHFVLVPKSRKKAHHALCLFIVDRVVNNVLTLQKSSPLCQLPAAGTKCRTCYQ